MANDLDGSRILVVEDEAVIAFDLGYCLSREGAEVVGPAMSLEQAKELVERERISAAVLDFRLGDDNAEPVAAALAARGIPFLFHSGQRDLDMIARRWPGRRSLVKPVRMRELIAAVEQLLPRPEPA